jgi:hypothetical protein
MATKVEKVCDLDSAPDAKTYRLAELDGDVYEIDLCPKHRESATLARIREKGRLVVDAKIANIGDAATRALVGKMRNRP